MRYLLLPLITLLLYLIFRKKKTYKDFSEIIVQISEAEEKLKSFTNHYRYFSNQQRSLFKEKYKAQYDNLKNAKEYQHLDKEGKLLIETFKSNYHNLDKIAQNY